MNNAKFEVQRSNNITSFETVGTLPSQNASSSFMYAFIDKVSGSRYTTLFYRIKQIDKDGKYSYSPVMKVKTEQMAGVQLIPNPVKEVATITSKELMKEMVITDISGRELFGHKSVTNYSTINVSSLAKGMYLVRISFVNGVQQTMRLVKE